MSDKIIFQANGVVDHALRTAGSIEGWQDNVGRYCVGNSRLLLAVSTAFAAPLLYPTASESGGFHLRGGSSTGKTTGLLTAGSVWGGGGIRGYVRTWRATSNGLEGVCALHCDSLLCLDEMGQVDGRDAGQIAYMLANGVGKSRANRNGEARSPAEWRLLFLSSGELSLADKIAEDGRGRRAAAGQQVRIVDIAADAGAGLGMFEDIHGFTSADAFARHLKASSAEHYGHPSRKFLRTLADNFDAIEPAVKNYIDQFLSAYCPSNADGQVSRVAARFGLVAAGGEMARVAGILPWPDGEATNGAARCFKDWLAARGGVEPAEEREAIAAVRRFIEAHGSSRFEAMGDLAPKDINGFKVEQRIPNRVGFRRQTDDGGVEYLVLPEGWKNEVCTGFDATAVAKALLARGMLVPRTDGKLANNARLPGFKGSARVYILSSALMADD